MADDPEPPRQGTPARSITRAPRFALAAALVAVGIVWIGQGVGWIGGSFMTGQAFWAVMGVLCLAVGATMLVRLTRTR